MSGFRSLARAMFSEDMNLFKYRTKDTAGKTQKLLFPLCIAAVIMFAMGYYAAALIQPLAEAGLAYIVPALAVVVFSIIGLFEGIYKVQGMLFDCRDNDLLFSLPIPRRRILAMRVLKLVIFQILYNALFIVPVLAVYAYFTAPGVSFYLSSALMLILAPLIPTAVAVLLGYIVRSIAVRFRFKKLAQTIGTLAIFIVVFLFAFNAESVLTDFMSQAASITDFLARLYYPAGAYARLVQGFNLPDFLGLLAVSILPFLAAIWLCSLTYFRVISRSTAHAERSKSVAITGHASGICTALVKKELGRYFSSPVFIFNTIISPIILVIAAIAMNINTDGLMDFLGGEAEAGFSIGGLFGALPTIFAGLLIFCSLMTSITSSAISIEGKSFNITKSLPVSPQQILFAKVLASLVIATPLLFLADLIFLLRFAAGPLDYLAILGLTMLVPAFSGLIGLIMNLKYPKMNAQDDTEVVKQSASSMLSVFIGMGAAMVCGILMVLLGKFVNMPLVLLCVFALLDFILWRVLCSWGTRKFRAIEA